MQQLGRVRLRRDEHSRKRRMVGVWLVRMRSAFRSAPFQDSRSVVASDPLLDDGRVDAAEVPRHLPVPIVQVRQTRVGAVETRVALEGEQPVFHGGERGEIVGREHLALHVRELDLDLIEPLAWTGPCTRMRFGNCCGRRSTARTPRCEESLTIQNTWCASRYGATIITCATRRSNGAMPVAGPQ